MNDIKKDANSTPDDVRDPETRPDNTVYLPSAANRQVNEDQINEDQAFYIPDFLSGEDDEDDLMLYSAAAEHAKHLIKAEGLLGEAHNLVEVLIASLADEVDARALQTESALRVVEKKLRKAQSRIDKHDMLHTNLFLAYFDLKEKTDGGGK